MVFVRDYGDIYLNVKFKKKKKEVCSFYLWSRGCKDREKIIVSDSCINRISCFVKGFFLVYSEVYVCFDLVGCVYILIIVFFKVGGFYLLVFIVFFEYFGRLCFLF